MKTLVISGGTRGIGRAIVEKFAQNGINIAFTYNSNEEEAKKIVSELESAYKIKAKYYKLDILEPDSLFRVMSCLQVW